MTIVFLHGFLGSPLNWGPIINLVRNRKLNLKGWKQIEFAARSLLWHDSGSRDDYLTEMSGLEKLMVEDMLDQISDLKSVILVGHSFGFRIALQVCNRLPETVKGLVCVDASPEISQKSCSFIRQILNDPALPFESRKQAKEHFENKYSGDVSMARFLMSNMRKNSEGKISWRFPEQILSELIVQASDQPLWEEWRQLSVPVVCIAGGNFDSHLSLELAEKMTKECPQPIQVKRIKDAGHWVHSDQPHLFVEDLISSLEFIGSWQS